MDAATAEVFDAFVRARHSALLRYGTALTGDPHSAADLREHPIIGGGGEKIWPRYRAFWRAELARI